MPYYAVSFLRVGCLNCSPQLTSEPTSNFLFFIIFFFGKLDFLPNRGRPRWQIPSTYIHPWVLDKLEKAFWIHGTGLVHPSYVLKPLLSGLDSHMEGRDEALLRSRSDVDA